MEDFYSRTRIILGDGAIEKLKNSRVILFGIGGVGGHIAEALGRSGIGHLTLVDPDTVSVSNLNRQIVALHSTLGRNKAEAMKERLEDISPDAQIEAVPVFFSPETAGQFDFTAYDYVIDAIDSMTGKVELARACKTAQVPLIAAMGAANKKNPAGFLVCDLSETDTCPLARAFRRSCRKIGIEHVTVAYSKEPAEAPFSQPPADGSRPVCGSLPWVPGALGLTIAARVAEDLIAGAGTVPR